ncbi:MFS general substrate transporter [Suillus occidentalis]|nr:MFS general substrate transporter [Suillus occidentalis]
MTSDHSDVMSISPSKEHVACKELDLDVEFGGTEARNKLERKLLWKLDLCMSMLVLMSILNLVTRLRGFVTDLHLEGQQFATVLSIFYVGYIITQIPSNMFLNYIGKPSLYLPACMVIWGLIIALTGNITNFVGALLTRFFLGLVEAAFFPGAVFLISKWYMRGEIGSRLAILYCGNMISNAFGALIASGVLADMDGVRAKAAWRWLFYIEGILTVTVAIMAVFVLPDFPMTTKWLTDDERRLALKRMEEDAGVGDQAETENSGFGYGFSLAITDWKVWWFAILAVAQNVAMSFVVYFPTLTTTLGHSDKTQERFFHMSTSNFIGIIGSLISICTMNTAARYLSLFFVSQSCTAHILMITWNSNTFARPPSKRAVCVSLINAFQQLGFIAGSYVWPSNWGPTYRYSYAIVIACNAIVITMTWILRLHLKTLNKKLEKEEQKQGIKEKGFRYVL